MAKAGSASRVLLYGCLLSALPAPAAETGGRADWLGRSWGVMIHYLPEWIDPAREWTSEGWSRQVDAFDVEAVARQLQEARAGYCLLSIGQNSGFYLAPNPTYDRLVGRPESRCSRRDLVADLAAALEPRGVRLLVYLPAGPPSRDPTAGSALRWQGDGRANREFQRRWEEVIRDWSRRWGTRVSGWWFDGCARPNTMYRSPEPPNFASFAAAARAGNPAAVVAFNAGMHYPVFSVSPHEDYTAGLVYDFERELANPRRLDSGRLDGARLHVVSFLGETWGRGEPRFPPEQAAAHTRKVLELDGAVTWDVPVAADGTIPGPFLARLRAIRDAASTAPRPPPRP